MPAFLIALLVFVALGFGLSHWLRNQKTAPKPGSNQGRDASQLGQLRWREFAKLVLQVMQSRGYRPVVEAGMPADGIPTDGGDILLQRSGERTLLSCKYGSASIVGAQPLLGLSQSATLRGATKVIVVTPGRFDNEAERLAQQQDIELIDGEDLWPEVRPYVARPTESAAPAEPAEPVAQSNKPIAIAWGGAAVAAAITWMIVQGLGVGTEQATEASPSPAAQVAQADQTAATPPADPAAPVNVVPTDPAELDQRRADAAAAISTLFGVDRAIWSTQSTLLVHLAAEEADPSSELCPLLERYPELAASRIQMQPPAGSARPVRFKQCRSY